MDRASTPGPAAEQAGSDPPPDRRRVQALTRRLAQLATRYAEAEHRLVELDRAVQTHAHENGRLRAALDQATRTADDLAARLAEYGELPPEHLRQRAVEVDREAAARLADADRRAQRLDADTDKRAQRLVADAEELREQARRRATLLISAAQEEAELWRRAAREELAEQAAAAIEENAATRRAMIDQVDRQCSRMLADAATLARELLQLADPDESRAQAREEAQALVRVAHRERADILADARLGAEEIVSDARREAADIIAAARRKADRMFSGPPPEAVPRHRTVVATPDTRPAGDRPRPQDTATDDRPPPAPPEPIEREPAAFVRALDLLQPAPWRRRADDEGPNQGPPTPSGSQPTMPVFPQFDTVLRGYDRTEVDNYVQWVARLDRNTSGTRTWRPAVFHVVLRGYDQAQVNAYVEQVDAVLRPDDTNRKTGDGR
ncbi:hypothetical protein [Micromonospora sp. NBC_01412]|uniref:hypothetical protein n=1 Tax=Micromonospora sp. NBC_01412 TaxID=2903590 RepID=UPI003243F419